MDFSRYYGCAQLSIGGHITITNLNHCKPENRDYWGTARPWMRFFKRWIFERRAWSKDFKWFEICGFEVTVC